eukprot:scaffold1557_cov108-Isochrysis_galbana.AAC.3
MLGAKVGRFMSGTAPSLLSYREGTRAQCEKCAWIASTKFNTAALNGPPCPKWVPMPKMGTRD